MKNKLLLIGNSASTRDNLTKYLDNIFNQHLEIIGTTFYNLTNYLIEDCDYIVFASGETKDKVMEKFKFKKDSTIASRFINIKNLDKILEIPENSKIYLVNDMESSCRETIDQFREIGLQTSNMTLFYPGIKPNPSIKFAITVGELDLVPRSCEKILNIESRILGIDTISKIISFFKLPIEILDKAINEYRNNLFNLFQIFNKRLKTLNLSDFSLSLILDKTEYGVCLTDNEYNVLFYNKRFLDILNIDENKVFEKSIMDIIEKAKKNEELSCSKETAEVYGNKYILIKIYDNFLNDSKFQKTPFNNTRYSFKDYKTTDKKILDQAMLASGSDLAVLIQGDTGTGKEILAQSIHNNSKRKNGPFIAVNFAAVQPNLIDSELFGYEKGSFTGALREGKKGFVEMAENGTLFLDEIGDAGPSLQIRLLRLLEEHTFIRIGGTKNIPVNFRLIASTNKNLYSLVKKGKFREDLFFRLSQFPIYVSSLNSRKSDINYLFDYFLPIIFNDKTISLKLIADEDVINFFNNYSWPGNVRELKNICSYMYNLKKQRIGLNDLPKYMFKEINDGIILSSVEKHILKIIKENPNIGRNKILKLLNENGLNISEGTVRSILNKLSDNELILVGKTKRGSSITDKGLILL